MLPLSFSDWIPYCSDGKASAYKAEDLGSIPGSGRSPGEGNGTLLQYSCLKNPMDRGAWGATVHGVTRVRGDLATEHACMCVLIVISYIIRTIIDLFPH